MRSGRALSMSLLMVLLGALAMAAGLTLVVWQAPVIQAGIFADD